MIAVTGTSGLTVPAGAVVPDRPAQGASPSAAIRYYTGEFKLSLNLYRFNVNLQAWLKGRNTAPPIDTLSAIRFAKQAGFDAVDVTSYYIPGFDFYTMPTKPREEIMAYARQIRDLCAELGIAISGTARLPLSSPPPQSR